MSSSSSPSPSPIRPVVRQFPSTSSLWEDSSLPLAVVLQPLVRTRNASNQVDSSLAAFPPPLASVPKCLSCGAPHPTRHSHFHPSNPRSSSSSRGNPMMDTYTQPSFLVCYLCGSLSSASPEQQQAARHMVEDEAFQETDRLYDTSSSSSQRTGEDNDTSVFALPLRLAFSAQATQQSSSFSPPIYQMPAMACPILWFVVLDATATEPSYWKTVHDLLKSSLESNNDNDDDGPPIPSHVHLSICCLTSTDCRLFQLDSPVPHLQTHPLESPVVMQRLIESAVPMDDVHRSHTQTTLRSLLDYSASQQQPPSSSHDDGDGLPLGWILSTLSEGLLQYGHAAGQRLDAHRDATRPLLPYAGAQVSVLLAQPPSHTSLELNGLSSTSTTTQSDQRTPTTRGVFGGRVVSPSWADPSIGPSSPTLSDWEPEILQDRYSPDDGATNEWIQYYADLGKQCTDAALTVDILGLAATKEHQQKDYGLALLAGLLKSGGGHAATIYPLDSSSMPCLHAEWTSRRPWRPSRAFGAELRLRTSPGLDVDAHTPSGEALWADLYQEGGLSGPAWAVEDERALWRMPSLDAYTTVAVDLRVTLPTVPHECFVEHWGNLALQPLMQTCLAYTTIETQEDGQAFTVRRMRISNCRLKKGHAVDTESLYQCLDPEALAVVLFHKLALASLQEGIAETPAIGQEWLQSLLTCAYRSAEQKHEKMQEQERQGLPPPNGEDAESNGNNNVELFISHDRLLNCAGGDFSDTDILLAKGHECLQQIPFMLYTLLQSHALTDAIPMSLDDRVAALWQLGSMSPHSLTRCLAPRLELWKAGPLKKNGRNQNNEHDHEPLVDWIELRKDAIQWTIQEECPHYSKDGLLLWADSPATSLVVDASLLIAGDMLQVSKVSHVSPGMLQAMQSASHNYKARPTVRYVTEESDAEGWHAFETLCCQEDQPLSTTASEDDDDNDSSDNRKQHANFEAWRQALAADVTVRLEDRPTAES